MIRFIESFKENIMIDIDYIYSSIKIVSTAYTVAVANWSLGMSNFQNNMTVPWL